MRPYVFVGSSSEGESVAYAIQENLERVADVVVWDQNVFQSGEYILESLLVQLNRADAGVLAFTPDDVLEIRGVEQAAARDNVLFELGLFIGKVGRSQSFAVKPRGADMRLPSDLLGISILEYEPHRGDGNLRAALGPACNRIKVALANVVPKRSSTRHDLELPIFERRDLLSNTQRRILRALEEKPSPSRADIQAAVSGVSGAELYYRLEHLRMMGFIEAVDETSGRGYRLSRAYVAARALRVSSSVPIRPARTDR